MKTPSNYKTAFTRICTAVALLASAATAPLAKATGLLMPIYGNTAAQFNAAATAAAKVPTIAIINPDDGPGSRKVGGISNQVKRLRGLKATVAGYIDTNYGGESLDSVESQIDKYKSWYGANSIFLDEMSDRTAKLGYYKDVYNYAKKKGMSVVGNPGTFTNSRFAAVANVLVTYEDPYAAGFAGYRQAGWTAGQPASKFGAMVYATAAADMQPVVDRAVAQRFGWIYVTNGGGADPFGAAPAYITQLCDAIRAKNGVK